MGAQYFVQALFAIAGIISLLAGICNWNWFFTSQNAQFVVRNVGRTKARFFYALIGLLMMGMACFFFFYTK